MDFTKISIRTSFFIFMISSLALAYGLPCIALATPAARPIFNVAVGAADSLEAGKLGEWVVEEDISDYKKFYFPAAFTVDEKNNTVLVLDSAKNRICAFSTSGKFLNEVKLPYEFDPIDIAWLPSSETLFVAFSNNAQLAALNIDLKGGIFLKSHKLVKLGDIGDRAVGIQNVWPCGKSADNIIAVTFNSGYNSPAAAFLYNTNGSLLKLRDIDGEMSYRAASHEKACIYNIYMNGTTETGIVSTDTKSGVTSKSVLPAEFLTKDSGMQCVSCRPVGADESGAIYVEAHFSSGEISENAFVYKFDKNMKPLGKTEIFTSPEMLSNRFVYVSASGAVYYMKLNIAEKKIEFYKWQ